MRSSVSFTILLYIVAVYTQAVLSRHTRILGLPEHRVRHSRHGVSNQVISNALQANSNMLDNALSTSESSRQVEELQQDILRSLGMNEPPSNRVNISDYMREVIIQDLGTASQTAEQEQHFMKGENVLLTARKAHREDHGEVMEFVLTPEDRADRIMEVKIYFHVNPLTIAMVDGTITEPMKLQLNMLTEQANGSFTKLVIEEEIIIHSHLVGWHNHEIHSGPLQHLLQQQGGDDVKLVFQLHCTNCHYEMFPEVITKQNVPFLTMTGRRRARRNGSRGCTGSCCLKGLIVDFNALGSKWDFVIHPRRYEANYCSGSCSNPTPMDRRLMTSNTHILNEVLSRQRAAATSSCCVAADEEHLLLAYYADGGAIRTSRSAIKKINSCRCA